VKLALLLALAGCSGQPMAHVADGGGAGAPSDLGPAPTYSQLYDALFAVGTPGHCATSGCHSPPIHIWTCGTTKETCWQGMKKVGLIDPANPSMSLIIDPQNSPLAWFNPNGPMPRDNPVANPLAAAAIEAWVAAGALDN
jgi:hypothetical protein